MDFQERLPAPSFTSVEDAVPCKKGKASGMPFSVSLVEVEAAIVVVAARVVDPVKVFDPVKV